MIIGLRSAIDSGARARSHTQVGLGPALVANLDGVVLVAVGIYHLGGAALEVDLVQCSLHVSHCIAQTVDQALLVADLVLQTSDVCARDVDGLVVA